MRAALLLLAFMLAGCQREKSFDERYAATRQQLETRAAEIDRQLPPPAPDSTPKPE